MAWTERLAFAVDFAQANLDDLPTRGWRRLRAGFEAFCVGGPRGRIDFGDGLAIVGHPVGPPDVGTIAELRRRAKPERRLAGYAAWHGNAQPEDVELRLLQPEVRARLRAFIERGLPQHVATATAPVSVSVSRHSASVPVPWLRGLTTVSLYGATRDVFLALLNFALADKASAALKRCPRCPRLFVRSRRQRYCSLRCTWAENKAALRRRKR